jgi:Right handed beta helix region
MDPAGNPARAFRNIFASSGHVGAPVRRISPRRLPRWIALFLISLSLVPIFAGRLARHDKAHPSEAPARALDGSVRRNGGPVGCVGVKLEPGDDIQAVVDRHPGNTRFCLADGTYLAQQVHPKTGDSFISTTGRARLDGQGREFAFRATEADESDVTIAGLEITGYLGRVQWGIIDGDLAGGRRVVDEKTERRAERWRVLFNNVHDNGGKSRGVAVGSGSLVRGNRINRNGMMGVGGTGVGTIWEYNEIGWNNTAHNNYGFEGGGSKFALSSDTTIRYNYVHDNYGGGLWTDYLGHNIKYYGNVVVNNVSSGLTHEISSDAEIFGNYIARNSIGNVSWLYGDAILLSTSKNVDVHDNWLADNAMGIIMTQARRGADFRTANNHVYRNHIASREGYTGLSQQDPGPDVERAGNYFRGNHYYTDQAKAWFWMKPMVFSAWQRRGQDLDGDVRPRSAWPGAPKMAVGPDAYPRTGTGS